MIRTQLRRTVSSLAPWLLDSYRGMRDSRALSHVVTVPHGFKLAGPPCMLTGGWEEAEINLFLDCLRDTPTCIDIGANVGFYTCLAASRGRHVVAVEPLARNLRFLYANLLRNGLSGVEVFPVALSDEPGLKRIYGIADEASLVPGWARSSPSRYSIVPTVTLDAIVGGRFRGRRLTIKVDVEGHEFDVLSGADQTLGLIPKPAWLIEVFLRNTAIPGYLNPRFYETFELFWRNGYLARQVNAGRQIVTPAEVSRWVANGAVRCPSSNFLFSSSD